MNLQQVNRQTARFAALSVCGVMVGLGVLGGPLADRAEAQDSLQLPGLNGGQLSESELHQGVSIVVVWASWSPRCRDIVERVNAIQDRWGKQGRVVTVNFQEDAAAAKGFLAGKPKLKAKVYLDGNGAFSKKHAVTTLAGLLVFKDGIVAYRGKLPKDANTLLAEVLR